MVTRLRPSLRRTFQVLGPVLLVGGLLLFVSNFFLFAAPDMFMGGSVGGFVAGTVGRALGGMALFLVGGILTNLGYQRTMAELTATESERATEHAATHAGRGLARGAREAGFTWGGQGRDIVKVRCRSCGALDSEDARFCSSCAQPM